MSNVENEALALADTGIRVFPCRPLDKRPAVSDWPNVATVDPTQIAEWFARPANLGLRCGQTAGGIDIFVVDIDIKNDQPGERSWADFCDEHPEVRAVAERTVSVTTPSGGWHFYFAAPDDYDCPRNSNPWPGVDIRGEGGYVLAPPSALTNGEYTWVRDLWEPNEGVMYAPPALMEALTSPGPVAEVIPIRTQVTATQLNSTATYSDDESPIEFMKREFSVYDWLLRHGWQGGSRRGQQEEMTRPGKSRREGTSATFHHDTNIVNVHTSTIPPEFMNVGKPTSNGGFTINGFDAWSIENAIFDRKEAMSTIRKTQMPQRPRAVVPAVVATSEPARTVDDDHPAGLNLPPEFWEKRPYLTHIRDAAWSKASSPDAVLAAVLARYSANLHPSIMLADWGTLDLFVVIAGQSGRFKSKASKTAARLYPGGTDKGVMMDRNVGSGEGLAEGFFEWRDEDGAPCGANKKGARKVMTRWGLHFSTDEGTALVSSAGRIGSIIIPTLCSAWMGESIGQMLADPTKSRMIGPNQVRVSAEVKIQTIHGWKLFAEEYAATGLAQRMLCFSSLDRTIFDRFEAGIDKPAWPGPLDLPTPHLISGQPREMEYAPEIVSHLARSEAQGHNPEWRGDPLDTHADLARLKVAAILALWDDRFDINLSDWSLSAEILGVHRLVRNMLQETQRHRQSDESHTRLETDIRREVGIDDGKHKALVGRAVQAIVTRIEAGKPLGQNALSKPQRDVYEEAMTLLEAQGRVVETDDGWRVK